MDFLNQIVLLHTDYGQAAKQPGGYDRRRTVPAAIPPPPKHQQRRRYNLPPPPGVGGIPPQEYSGPSGVVGPPAGHARSSLVSSEEEEEAHVTNTRARQYNFDIRARKPAPLPRRQNYYSGSHSSRRNPHVHTQQYPTLPHHNRRSSSSWGPSAVYQSQMPGNHNRYYYNSYPYTAAASAYRGRSNSFQGRRNNKIPVFYY
jgi:hypothetical protein